MFDPSIWFPQSDDDARLLAPGQFSSVQFEINIFQMFAPVYFSYQNTDNILHSVRLQLAVAVPGGPFGSIYAIDVPAGGTRLLFPGQTIPSSGTPTLESRGPYVFTGPLFFIFRNSTAANIAHTPIFNSRWLQAKVKMKGAQVGITREVT